MIKKTEEYVCPKCGSHNVTMDDLEISDGLTCEMYCEDCDTAWVEFYKIKYDGYNYQAVVYDKDGEKI